jgi:hypothetical protein
MKGFDKEVRVDVKTYLATDFSHVLLLFLGLKTRRRRATAREPLLDPDMIMPFLLS